MGAQQRAAENNSARRLRSPPSTAQHRPRSDPIWGRHATAGMWHRAQPRQCGDTALPTARPPPPGTAGALGGCCCRKASATERKMGQRRRSLLYFLSVRSAGDMDGYLNVSQARDRRSLEEPRGVLLRKALSAKNGSPTPPTPKPAEPRTTAQRRIRARHKPNAQSPFGTGIGSGKQSRSPPSPIAGAATADPRRAAAGDPPLGDAGQRQPPPPSALFLS